AGLHLSDVIPIDITRTYRQNDPFSRYFGKGDSLPYGMLLSAQDKNHPYVLVNLMHPDGGQIQYSRVSPGTGQFNAAFQETVTPGMYFHSRLSWNVDRRGWDLSLADGTVYQFSDFNASGWNAVLRQI